MTDEVTRGFMPKPAKFHVDDKAERDIAYDEMLKYLDDTEIISPKRAEMEKDMSESDDEYGPPDAAPGTDLWKEFIRRRNMEQRCIGVGYF